MSEYESVKQGKLVLKGEKQRKRKKKQKNKEATKGENTTNNDEDVKSHGGWCKAEFVKDITGSICIEFGNQTYLKALDNGYFTVGPPHKHGDGPSPEEILTAVVLSDTKVVFKSGYGKYIGYNKDSCVIGKADAIGPLEQWEPVFQDSQLALLSSNGCFMGVRPSDDTLVVTSRTAGENEIIQVRYEASVKERDPLEGIPEEERGSISQIEVNYVRKFQKFQDKKLRLNTGERVELVQARSTGKLHETLLDRRSKMKSDRYCK